MKVYEEIERRYSHYRDKNSAEPRRILLGKRNFTELYMFLVNAHRNDFTRGLNMDSMAYKGIPITQDSNLPDNGMQMSA